MLCWHLSLVTALGSASQSTASTHLVPPIELRAALVGQSHEREANLTEIRTLLSSEAVRNQRGLGNLHQV